MRAVCAVQSRVRSIRRLTVSRSVSLGCSAVAASERSGRLAGEEAALGDRHFGALRTRRCAIPGTLCHVTGSTRFRFPQL
jgi:hypothetical protein